jgi:hypothetical protein
MTSSMRRSGTYCFLAKVIYKVTQDVLHYFFFVSEVVYNDRGGTRVSHSVDTPRHLERSCEKMKDRRSFAMTTALPNVRLQSRVFGALRAL